MIIFSIIYYICEKQQSDVGAYVFDDYPEMVYK